MLNVGFEPILSVCHTGACSLDSSQKNFQNTPCDIGRRKNSRNQSLFCCQSIGFLIWLIAVVYYCLNGFVVDFDHVPAIGLRQSLSSSHCSIGRRIWLKRICICFLETGFISWRLKDSEILFPSTTALSTPKELPVT